MNLNVIFKVKPLKGPRKPNVVEQSLSEYFAPEYVSVSLIWKKSECLSGLNQISQTGEWLGVRGTEMGDK